MPDTNVENIKTFNNKQILTLLGAAIFTTFSLTTIYSKFIFNDEEIQLNKESIQQLIENVKELEENKASNSRLDKKAGRIEDRVSELEKPNSDKNK